MSTAVEPHAGSQGTPLWVGAAVAASTAAAAVVVGLLVGSGLALVALGLALAVPMANLLLRRPGTAVVLWLLITPFVVATEGGVLRKVYWVSHRLLPVVGLAVVLLATVALIRSKRLPRLGWAELAMGGYLGVTLITVLFLSPTPIATTFHVYDRVAVPMALYLLVRLIEPRGEHLKRLVPVVGFVLLAQAIIGLLAWVAPEVLPSAWLNRLGTRTTGSLKHPNVYGTTVLIAGLFLLHVVLSRRDVIRRPPVIVPSFLLGLVMAFMTYSRATWLAGVVILMGVALTYRRFGVRFLVVAVIIVTGLVSSGAISGQLEMARYRFRSEASEHSALSRLPVIQASLRMAQERPLLGWGYGNFDRVSPQFQQRVGSLIVPDKEHASHNLYLTLLAEQGVVGLLLYLGPALYWLVASRRAWSRLPRDGLVSRRLLAMLWLALASHVIVNNYSNMRVVFGLGLWWLTLGMIAVVVSRADRDDDADADASQGRAPAATAALSPMRGGRRGTA